MVESFVPVDRAKVGKGFAYVSFLLPERAVRAWRALDGKFFQGRVLHLLPARAPGERGADTGAADATGSGSGIGGGSSGGVLVRLKGGATRRIRSLDELGDDEQAAMTYKQKKDILQKLQAENQVRLPSRKLGTKDKCAQCRCAC